MVNVDGEGFGVRANRARFLLTKLVQFNDFVVLPACHKEAVLKHHHVVQVLYLKHKLGQY